LQELSLLLIFLVIHVAFYFAKRDNKLVYMDIAWGLGFFIIALVGYLTNVSTKPKLFLLLMVALWGLRLSVHCFLRQKKEGEDWRYKKLKTNWGSNWLMESYKKVFLFQGLMMFFISLPVQLGMTGLWDYFSKTHLIGMMLFLFGFGFEVYADYTLLVFKRKNPGTICTVGVWKLCRFPHYLGEIILWIGIYIYIFNFWSSWTIIGPAILIFCLIKVTGIPMVEEKLLLNPDYQVYAKNIPRLWPITKSRIKYFWTNLYLEKKSH
jgi:steroid 5-alpha reductase family enzyme